MLWRSSIFLSKSAHVLPWSQHGVVRQVDEKSLVYDKQGIIYVASARVGEEN